MTSITALLSRGATGLEAASPLEFASLVLPRSPNTCLAAPGWHPGFKHLETPIYPVSTARGSGPGRRGIPPHLSARELARAASGAMGGA